MLHWHGVYPSLHRLLFGLFSHACPGFEADYLAALIAGSGILFGFVRGYGLVLIVFVAAVFATEGEKNLPRTVQQAAVRIIFLDFYRDQLISLISCGTANE